MLRNYLTVGLRNILKHKSFSFINIFGLAAAMSVCMLIIMVIADQKGYDSWQAGKDRVYRIQTTGKNGSRMQTATSALPLGDKLRKDYTGIEAAATLVRGIGGDILYKQQIASGGGYFADGNLFRVMDFHLEQGDARTALDKPFSMVITADLAAQLFHNEDPIGKTIKFNNTGLLPGGPESGNIESSYGQFLITGVLKPNPGKTTLPFKLLASFSSMPSLAKDTLLSYTPNDWNAVWNNYTFVRMEKGHSRTELQNILDRISDQQYPKGPGDQFAFKATPLSDLMPADPISNPTNIAMPRIILVILSVLCLVVMLSACLNYTNLSIARMLTRTKEVGIRKVSGATRRQVFTQFISEAILMSLLSLLLSFLILLFLQKMFTGLWLNQFMNITFHYTPTLFLIFLGFSVAVGFLAGLLPSIYISLFNPVHVLKGLNNLRFFSRLTLRKVLLVVQFCVSLVFIISTSLIYLQGKHVLNFDYGFKKENVVNVKLYKLENYNRFAQAIATSREIGAVSACSFLPATGTNMSEMIHKAADKTDSLQTNYIDIGAGCLQVWGLHLVAGRNLPAISADSDDHYVLVNEKMAAGLKYSSAKQAVGQHIILNSGKDAEIVGVVKDFQFLEVMRGIEPLMLRNRKSEFAYATISVQGKHLPEAVAFLQETWKKVNPSTKFEYQFFDQQLLTTHSMMSDTVGVLGLLAFLAVVISCLGLLGMATYTAETRRKEIGVRKVLGSGIPSVVFLLSKGYMILLGTAILIAVPLAILLNNMWLQFFASRVSITPWILLGNISILAAISFLIVFSQAWKVSTANPVNSLRSE
ncbi:MAG TPA: ABC transporter permease [Puia sp.]|uniref:ABC transporter permease n=1 Tax=Puia sp. TaxID=2045100 RepID=UPI002BF76DB5|nr:ABC transporter permease [Puia sp.]HVU98603.1 ABC transporter permease [Puia sp.]